MKFRKKPVIVEAIQYTGKNGGIIKNWSGGAAYDSPVLEPREDNPTGEKIQIETLEGIMTGIVGCWIVRGTRGEYYPVKEEIFKEIYEEVPIWSA